MRSLWDEDNSDLDNDDNDNEDNEFVIELTSQNILRSKDKMRFRCRCSCTVPFIRRNFLECQEHLRNFHRTTSVTPRELCISCQTTNPLIWQKRHQCNKMDLRGKRHWQTEDEEKYWKQIEVYFFKFRLATGCSNLRCLLIFCISICL